jgi:hypothetical protein
MLTKMTRVRVDAAHDDVQSRSMPLPGLSSTYGAAAVRRDAVQSPQAAI